MGFVQKLYDEGIPRVRKWRKALRMDDRAEGMMTGVIAVLIGLAVVVALYVIIPMLGDQIENSVSFTTNSTWDPAINTNIVSGQTLWETGSGLGNLVITVSLIALVISVIMGLAYIRGREGL